MTKIGELSVSRETIDKLEHYADALRKWNPKINLVSKSTIDDLWARHFVDSAQVWQFANEQGDVWADLGSGGGFPGLVVAIIAAELREDLSLTLVESDQRKSAFLRSVARETSTAVTIISRRIEELPTLQADVISARAVADLDTLLSLSHRHLAPQGLMLFPKGENWRKELTEAQSKWRFDYEVAKSKTNEKSVILRISGVCRA
ncbi:16S rRNA methyltransferase [Roseovarius atlanticus]|uniref:Ribosomal RNA small subunit methyltransferase G n=1 Tax=Roseovarius atlanticus TaxID=1641875 RepID=A0A0T5NQK0_9RHOB|nr:16S rRNA (guanine(527)-N(7))-methyltransferase RsmG [Roseovarius atlanticus]KRS11227.1 16S rRNA methyltransferase [Roseovarius atlanticus]